MTATLLVGLLTLLPLGPMPASPSDSVDFRLERHQWEHRLLFVFASADTSDVLGRQEEQFRGRGDGFQDRDLLLVTIEGGKRGTLRKQPDANPQPLTESAVHRLRERFPVPPDSFRVVLVGKDGTEKRRDPEPVTARSIFDSIDAMPMRQREMREQGNGGG